MRAAICLVFALALASCDSSPVVPPADTVSASNAPAPESSEEAQFSPSPQQPIHNYIEKEGSVYLYEGAVSENDQKAGKAIGDILSYEYLGIQRGKYVLTRLNDDHSIFERLSCNNPCIVIDADDGRKIAYNEKSIVGAAFADAIAGMLTVAVERRPSAENQDLPQSAASPYRPLPRYENISSQPAGTPIQASDQDYTPTPAVSGDGNQ